MAKKFDIPVAEKLLDLYELQKIDSDLDQLETMKGELPMEVNDLEDEIAGLNTRMDKFRSVVGDLQTEITSYKTRIKDNEALVKKYQKQMDNVKNNREFEALTKEQEMTKLDIQLFEKKIRELEALVTSKTEAESGIQEKLAAKQKELGVKQEELAKILEKTEKEEEKLRKKSNKARQDIEERLLKAYDKIRDTYRNKLAVVTIQRGACGGCYNTIPPQIQLEISIHKNITACEHCGRIMVDDTIINPIAREVAARNE